MTPTRLFAATSLAAATALLAACSAGGDEADDLAEQASDDLNEFAALAADLAAGAEAIEDGARATATETYETIGECSVTAEFDGLVLNGSFSIAADTTPCGLTVEASGRSAEYRVDAFEVSGDWTGTPAGEYTITASGSRDATLIVTRPRAGTNEYDSSFTLSSLTAEVDDGAVTELAVTITYDGYGGQT